MNKVFTLFAAVILSVSVFAQSPEKISYQAVIRNASNNLVTSKSVGIQISILQGSSSGTAVYTETQTPTTNANGLVSIEIGGGAGFSTINWANGPYFIKTETDPTGGTNYTITGTSQLLSVPFALYAAKVVNLSGTNTGDETTTTIKSKLGITTLSGSNTGDQDLSGKVDKITGKGLSTNDYTTAEQLKVSNLSGTNTGDETTSTIKSKLGITTLSGSNTGDQDLSGKVDKITGKGLSTNDYTTAEQSKLAGIASGTATGDMQYWNGTAWVRVPVGLSGQYLQLSGNIPTWSGALNSATVVTNAITVGGTTATSGGNVLNDGGATITARGVCWSTNPNPTIADNITTDGSGTGGYASSFSVAYGITYYVRAYAVNSSGTSYGGQVSTTVPLAVGNPYQGGLVAYILQPGDPGYVVGQTHGLIVATTDQSTSTDWGCEETLIAGANGATMGTGNQNTIDIEAGCTTAGTAADLCASLTLNGYSDWYLPSLEELTRLSQNRVAIGMNFAFTNYWSSTQRDEFTAKGEDIGSGTIYNYMKTSGARVRAIRSF